MKKIIACIVAVCLCITMMPKSAMAEENDFQSQIPNAVVMMDLDNIDCEKIDTLKNMKLIIKNDYNGEVVEVANIDDVQVVEDEYAVMVLGQSLDEINEEVLDKLKAMEDDLQEIVDKIDMEELDDSMLEDLELSLDEDEIEKKLEEILGSYKIEIQGEDAHFTVEDATGMLITSDLIKEAIDLVKELLWELLEVDIRNATTISEALDMIAASEDISREELIEGIVELFEEELPITADEINGYIAQADEILEYLLSERYNGTVFATGLLVCDCVKYEEYYISHYYYKVVDGERQFVGWEDVAYSGIYGEVKTADQFEKLPVYEGETYKFVRSADVFDEEVEMTQFTVGEDIGLAFIYELEETKKGAATKDKDSDKADKTDKKENYGDSPDTGDEMNLAAYIAAMIIAMGAMVVSRGRK